MPAPDDPFDVLLRPPPDESPADRMARLEREAEAKRVSLAIDASIKAEKAARRKKRIVRLLLLGQSESGKSTTLRQFQRLYTPTAFREERILWRAVIQLNIVRSIRTILDAISYFSSPRVRTRSLSRSRQPPPPLPQHSPPQLPIASSSNSPPYQYPHHSDPNYTNNISSFSIPSPPTYPPPLPPKDPPANLGLYDDDNSDTEYSNIYYHHRTTNHDSPNHSPHQSPQSHPSPSSSFTLAHSSSSIPLAPASLSALEALRARLFSPLQHVEAFLISKILQQEDSTTTHFSVSSPAAVDHTEHASRAVSILGDDHHQGQSSPTESYFTRSRNYRYTTTNTNGNNSHHYTQELSIRFGPGWRGVLSNARVDVASLSPSSSDASSNSPTHGHGQSSRTASLEKNKAPAKDEAQEILYSLRKDIIQLWHDPAVREILRKRKIKLEESSGFFLDDIERVTALRFLPSDDDVLKARLKTVGVSEYKFEIELGAGRDTGTEWRIIDVGGSRSQRPTWVPYFDDVDAIIFLAPISAFDKVLSEDRSINRLEDSVLLWKAVCSSKLLAGVDLILFLNKCDILEKKLTGVRMAKYVRNYGDRPNDLDSVTKYLRGKFSAIHREYSPNPRKFYAFCTSVTDTSTTAGIIASVRDMVIRQHLKSSKLL